MTDFYSLLDEYLGEDDALTDIRVTVRRLWFYDFLGSPLYIWQGKGKLFTSDGNVWLGTIDPNNRDIHQTPSIQDGRDGSSMTYQFGLTIPDIPGKPALQSYNEIKAEQWRASGRMITCYLGVFKEGEALRPQTPIVFFQQLNMMSVTFNENLAPDGNGGLVREYVINISAKDNNFGRSNIPGGTYTDTIQKQRALDLGVAVDKGCEYVAILANRTYTVS